MNAIFRLSNFLVLPVWALMIILPRWRWTERIMKSAVVSIGPVLVYSGLALSGLPVIWPVISRPTLGGVAQLLGSPARGNDRLGTLSRPRSLRRALDLPGQLQETHQPCADVTRIVLDSHAWTAWFPSLPLSARVYSDEDFKRRAFGGLGELIGSCH